MLYHMLYRMQYQMLYSMLYHGVYHMVMIYHTVSLMAYHIDGTKPLQVRSLRGCSEFGARYNPRTCPVVVQRIVQVPRLRINSKV